MDNVEKQFEDFISDIKYDDVPSAQHREKLEQNLLAAMTERSRHGQANSQIWRIILKNPKIRLATAAAIIIAVLIGIHYLGGSIDGANVAWADVIEPILKAPTLTYTLLVGEDEGIVVYDRVMRSRIRRTVSNMSSIIIIDIETSRVLTLQPEEKIAVYFNMPGLSDKMHQDYITRLRNQIAELQKSPEFSLEEIGTQEIEGRRAVVFEAKNPNVEMTIWADPETATPIRIEVQRPQFRAIYKNFQFDVKMEESLFSMEVPEGYSLQETEFDLFTSTEQDFIEGLRIWTELFKEEGFPENFSAEYIIKQSVILAQKIDQLDLSEKEKMQLLMKVGRGLAFTRFYKGEGQWHYAGNSVKPGDADSALFWYRPKDSETFRVIYGDLSVRNVAPENLPR
jgi:outer membrane lipoprotein-sorting protein